jgi:hypothetical protein
MNESNGTEKRPRRRAAWGGLILVFIGLVFLLQQFGFSLHNWWAVFILIPAFGSLGTAVSIFQRTGRFNYAVRSSLFSGLIVLMVALMFFLELNWGIWWPMFVILPGLSFVVNGLPLDGEIQPGSALMKQVFRPWSIGIGLGALLLGLGFLFKNLGIYDPSMIFSRWWAIAILVPAAFGLLNTLFLAIGEGLFSRSVVGNLLISIIVAVPGLVAFLGVDWNMIMPLALISVGLVLIIGYLIKPQK